MTTSRIYAYRWPARLVSHKPFAAESYSITPSCIWQVFFRKKNEFSFLFSPFCQRAHFLCKMHNPQAFLPVENSAVPAAQCLVWTVLPLLYIYNKKQSRSATVLALSVKACQLCQLSQRESPWQPGKVPGFHKKRLLDAFPVVSYLIAPDCVTAPGRFLRKDRFSLVLSVQQL